MNPVSYSLQNIHRTIPRDILEKVFISIIQHRYTVPVSLDARIRELVIEPWVMVDCNLVGGTETFLPLEAVPREQMDPFTVIYRIPKSMTQGRTITSALSVSFGQGSIIGSTNMGLRGSSPMLDAASSVMNAQLPIPMVSSAYCTLIGENVVLIGDNIALPTNLFLRCKLENDEAFTHLKPTSYMQFAQLVEYAIKAYIYTNSAIVMDRAFIHAGADLGRMKEIIDSYSDAFENYKTYFRETWQKVSILNDYTAHRRHLQMITGGAH